MVRIKTNPGFPGNFAISSIVILMTVSWVATIWRIITGLIAIAVVILVIYLIGYAVFGGFTGK